MLTFTMPKRDEDGDERGRVSRVKAGTAYAAAIVKAINGGIRKGEYPRMAKERGQSGKVKLRLVLKPDGKVSKVEVVSSSGHPALDQYALELARRTIYPPFPAALRGTSQFQVEPPVNFVLTEE
ncbi:MAG: energy transducer TonB [Burkholderiales bacterium]